MKYLKKFNENQNELLKKIEDYMQKEFNSDWFDLELSNRVYDYIDSEDAESYDDDYEEAYKNLCTGGAIEYDLIEYMVKNITEHFSIDRETIIDDKRNIDDIVHDHLMDTCTWKDSSVFYKRSTEPYRSMFDRMFGTNWDSGLDSDIEL